MTPNVKRKSTHKFQCCMLKRKQRNARIAEHIIDVHAEDNTIRFRLFPFNRNEQQHCVHIHRIHEQVLLINTDT